MFWTEENIPEQTGCVAVVTGANSGLGFHTARALSEAGAKVVITARTVEKTEEAATRIWQDHPGAELVLELLDLADLTSIREFVSRTEAALPKVSILVNNAGVMAIPRSETKDGFETQLGVNHLGYFALTGLLMPRLKRAAEEDGFGRIVNVSSNMHKTGRINFDDLMGSANYNPWTAYSQSKLANLLFTLELGRRLKKAGSSVIAVAAHPGYAATNLQRRGPEAEGAKLKAMLMDLANRLFAQPVEKGVLPQLYAAVSQELNGNEYIGPDGFGNMRGYPAIQQPAPQAKNLEDAERLWEVSESLTGVTFSLQS
jgi:NAD(P)-dependent dehydrogenase (short-subunit alcohol dehydrogenase family)